jgi:predicted DCC family thiol-disulfide oxidoreductase YuxK
MPDQPTWTVVLYDGVCGLCNRFVSFLLRRDCTGRLQFAPLQGDLARDLLSDRARRLTELDTVYVIADWQSPGERVLERSRAVLYALSQLDGSGWRLAARVAALAPVPLADAVYRVVARRRYRLFGRLPLCPVPPAEWRNRFLD